MIGVLLALSPLAAGSILCYFLIASATGNLLGVFVAANVVVLLGYLVLTFFVLQPICSWLDPNGYGAFIPALPPLAEVVPPGFGEILGVLGGIVGANSAGGRSGMGAALSFIGVMVVAMSLFSSGQGSFLLRLNAVNLLSFECVLSYFAGLMAGYPFGKSGFWSRQLLGAMTGLLVQVMVADVARDLFEPFNTAFVCVFGI